MAEATTTAPAPATTAAAPAVTAPAVAVPPVPKLPHGVRLYEAMWVVDANAGREDYSKCLNGIREIVEKGGGSWINADKWEERRLAYSIKKKKRGLYIISYFRAPGTAVSAIERDVNLSEDILRVLVTDAEHLNEGEMNAVEPQPIIREERPSWERNDRFDRGGYGDRGDRGGDRGGEDRRPPRREDRAPREERAPAPAPAGEPASAGGSE